MFIRREADGGKAQCETVCWDSRRFRRIPDLPRMQGGKSVRLLLRLSESD